MPVFRKMLLPAIAVAAIASLWMPSPGFSADITSAYTKILLDQCDLFRPPVDESTDGGSWRCGGYDGIPVYVAEGDLRMFVSFGDGADNEPAAQQTFSAFNRINETLEWRLRNGRPFATILRWFPQLDDSGKEGSVLIVTQLLPGGGTCQIARVDAQANRNANVIARQAADTMAGSFNCASSSVTLGNPGILGY